MKLLKPLFIYDGDCGFCRKWVARLQNFLGDQLDFKSFQEVSQDFPHITLEHFNQSVFLIQPDGTYTKAAQAMFSALALRWDGALPLFAYNYVPFFSFFSELVYRFIARNRTPLSALDRGFTGLVGKIPTYSFSTGIFLRGMAFVYLTAFSSLIVQIKGLLGVEGIVPAKSFLARVFQEVGLSGFIKVPTIFWLDASNPALLLVCGLGMLLALLALIGLGGGTNFLVLWFLYLSLVSVGHPFLSFQWDTLLLEAGLLAVCLAPWRFGFYKFQELRPSLLGRWLVLLLLFRLMIFSGLVKIFSGDEAWLNFTALSFHYETQPLPTPLAYFMHQLPLEFHQLSVGILFFLELVVPFLIFAPRRPQLVCAACLIGLQGLIILTGNYCFFNILTILMCLLLIDDSSWSRRCTWNWIKKCTMPSGTPVWRLPSWVLLPLASLVILISTMNLTRVIGVNVRWPAWILSGIETVEPFRSINSYGLFAVMTKERREIVVQGSNDGKLWLEYKFKFKPEEVTRAPMFLAPHQPRLDWQMWFAALGTFRNNPWFLNFGEQLLRGNQDVINLLERNPFPNHPPELIRAVSYRYTFTSLSEWRDSGKWWTATKEEIYLPPMSLKRR